MRGVLEVVFAGLLGSAQVPAPPAVALEWAAPPECPDRDALLAGVARRRGRPLEPGQARVVARAAVAEGDPRRYRLELVIDVGGHHDRRELRANTCAALVDAAALVIALAVDGEPEAGAAVEPAAGELSEETGNEGAAEVVADDADAGVPSPEPAPPPGPARPAELAELEPPAPLAPAPARRRRPGGLLRLHGLGELGALPGASGGVGLAGGLLWRWVRVELQAAYLAPRGQEVRVSLAAGAALACARPAWGAFELPVCAGLEAGGLVGAAETADGRRSAVGRWLAATGGVGAALRVHPRVALWAFLQGIAAIQRGTFALREPGAAPGLVELFDPGVGSGRLALGVELRFGDPR